MKAIEKYKKLSEILSRGLVGKEEIIKSGLLTILCRENMILVGPPGTAKSEIARRLTMVIKGGTCYEYLLTRYTTPEELFGPLSLTKLKEDKFERNTKGYLPDANIGFLDEIFKANSNILNSLLTIINERIYHNGNIPQKTNIVSIIGASNELPTNEPELQALYDRFLMKKEVGYLSERDFNKLYSIDPKDRNITIPEEYQFTVEEIKEIGENAKKININDSVKIIINQIRKDLKFKFKDDEVEQVSDRKWIKLLDVCRLSAYLNGREEVTYDDVAIIKDCLWKKLENREEISKILDICNRKSISKLGRKI